ncbi:hypothetical protein M0802_005657 [Mischocyttarus mexicanus]|nr:hypothetical protein M0802_005657 [Mischocyttarus mexicanus]
MEIEDPGVVSYILEVELKENDKDKKKKKKEKKEKEKKKIFLVEVKSTRRIRGMRKPKDDEGRGVKHGAVALVLGISFGSKGVGEGGLPAFERIEGRTTGR